MESFYFPQGSQSVLLFTLRQSQGCMLERVFQVRHPPAHFQVQERDFRLHRKVDIWLPGKNFLSLDIRLQGPRGKFRVSGMRSRVELVFRCCIPPSASWARTSPPRDDVGATAPALVQDLEIRLQGPGGWFRGCLRILKYTR